MSPTGNNRGGGTNRPHHRLLGRRAFTFFEIMVTTGVLAVGITMTYRALLVAVDYQDHLSHRLVALQLLSNKREQIERLYRDGKTPPLVYPDEVEPVRWNNRTVEFLTAVSAAEAGDLPGLTRFEVSLSWKERGREIRLTRAFCLYRQREKAT